MYGTVNPFFGDFETNGTRLNFKITSEIAIARRKRLAASVGFRFIYLFIVLAYFRLFAESAAHRDNGPNSEV